MFRDRSVKISAMILFIVLPFAGYLAHYWDSHKQNPGVSQLSLSSDGRYVIGNKKNEMILWDIETKTRKRIAKNANIYSAYFVKNTLHYLYQDLNNTVHVKNLDGKEVQNFTLDFPTYGQLMTSDLSRYFASDKDYRIIKREAGEVIIMKGLDRPDGLFSGKLLNVSLSSDEKLLLATGSASGGPEPSGKEIFIDDEITQEMKWPHHLSRTSLWDVQNNRPKLASLALGHKQSGALSPAGNKMVSTCEQDDIIIYDLTSYEYLHFLDYSDAVFYFYNDNRGAGKTISKNQDVSQVVNIFKHYPNNGLRILFLSPTEYLKINAHSTFAFLYSLDSVVPLAYLDLGSKPFPNVHDYSRNGAMDSAPAAHRFVIGKHNEPGILVYDYDPQARTLTKIWDAR
jgi:WD40 repeat protein